MTQTTFNIALRNAPNATITSDTFQVYDRGDLVFLNKSSTNEYDLDSVAAFASGSWLYVSKA